MSPPYTPSTSPFTVEKLQTLSWSTRACLHDLASAYLSHVIAHPLALIHFSQPQWPFWPSKTQCLSHLKAFASTLHPSWNAVLSELPTEGEGPLPQRSPDLRGEFSPPYYTSWALVSLLPSMTHFLKYFIYAYAYLIVMQKT